MHQWISHERHSLLGDFHQISDKQDMSLRLFVPVTCRRLDRGFYNSIYMSCTAMYQNMCSTRKPNPKQHTLGSRYIMVKYNTIMNKIRTAEKKLCSNYELRKYTHTWLLRASNGVSFFKDICRKDTARKWECTMSQLAWLYFTPQAVKDRYEHGMCKYFKVLIYIKKFLTDNTGHDVQLAVNLVFLIIQNWMNRVTHKSLNDGLFMKWIETISDSC